MCGPAGCRTRGQSSALCCGPPSPWGGRSCTSLQAAQRAPSVALTPPLTARSCRDECGLSGGLCALPVGARASPPSGGPTRAPLLPTDAFYLPSHPAMDPRALPLRHGPRIIGGYSHLSRAGRLVAIHEGGLSHPHGHGVRPGPPDSPPAICERLYALGHRSRPGLSRACTETSDMGLLSCAGLSMIVLTGRPVGPLRCPPGHPGSGARWGLAPGPAVQSKSNRCQHTFAGWGRNRFSARDPALTHSI